MHENGLTHAFLQQSALSYLGNMALIQRKKQATFKELAERPNRISHWLLARGLKPGDRIAILTEQPCEYVANYFRIFAAGGDRCDR